jgi:ankyrin repeat protein
MKRNYLFCLFVCITIMLLFALFSSDHAFCGEIDDSARMNDIEKIKALLKGSPNLVAQIDEIIELEHRIGNVDPCAGTLLHWTIRYGRNEIAEILLKQESDIKIKDACGNTFLHYAVFRCHKEIAALLLAKKADVNAKGYNDVTALHVAVERGYKDIMELLLANRADVNAKDKDGWTPLHLASEPDHGFAVSHTETMDTTLLRLPNYKDVAELLLSKGADVNSRNNKGETPLHLAFEMGNTDASEFLRQHGGHE